jgi:hypothetical protein
MDWKSVISIFLVVLLNTIIVLVILFLFFKARNKGRQKKKFVIDKIILYRRLNLAFFLALLLAGNWLVFSFFQKEEQLIEFNNVELEGFSGQFEDNQKDFENFRLPEPTYSNGLNLVFFADQYSNWEEFDSDIDFLMKGIKTVIPWNNYMNYNVYKIFSEEGNKICSVKTEDERKPFLRCNEGINKYLNKLPLMRFKLVVLSRQEFQSWANISRLKDSGIFFSLKDKISEEDSQLQNVLFAHLMAHAFGLKDEEKYVLAKGGGAPHTPDGPNCAPDKETAEKWWGDLAKENEQVDYFNTCCGNDEYIKPTKGSLMNLNSGTENFDSSYGPVSERYLNKILNYCFLEEKVEYEDDKDFFDRYPEFRECL